MSSVSALGFYFGALAFSIAPCSVAPAIAQAGCDGSNRVGMTSVSTPCARVEERIRLDPRARRDMSPWGMPNAFAPMSDVGVSPAHQRLDGGYGLNPPRLR
jgi:hypothetical protein